MNKTVTLIIDGNNLMHRTFWVSSQKNSKTIINPMYLFLLSLKRLVKELKATDIIIAWDHKLEREKTSYRKILCKEYKGNRDYSGKEDMFKQEVHLRNIVESLGVRNILPGCLEADDVIYWLCNEVKGRKIIASADSDLHQLIDADTTVYDFNKKIEINIDNFTEITGFSDVPEYMQVKSLVGDKSDNISGIPRCGVKTAKKIIRQGISTLSEDHLSIYKRNQRMISLSTGLQEHPEELSIYMKQYKKDINSSISTFKQACKQFNMQKIIDNPIEWEEIFFNTSIENAAASCIHSLFKLDDNT